jgi:hypothetical protein
MVLQTWIVPEPDPRLSLEVSNIDIRTLNYHDIKYITSSSMKKYFDEFRRLPDFIVHADNVIKKYNDKQKHSPPPIKRATSDITNRRPCTPYKVLTPPIISKVHQTEKAKKFNYQNTLEQYEKYLVTGKNSSETCIIH